MIEMPDVVVLLILFGIFMVLAGFLGFTCGTLREDSITTRPWVPTEEDIEDFAAALAEAMGYKSPGPEPEPEVQEREPEFGDIQPIPIDPANPPVHSTFNPHPSKPLSGYPVCNCHSTPLRRGDNVVRWPIPDQQGVLLFHADWLKEQGMSPA